MAVEDTHGRHRYEGRASARTRPPRRAAVRPRITDAVDGQTAMERAQPRGLPGFENGIALLDLLDTLSDERREAFLLT